MLTAFEPITEDPGFCQIYDWCCNINNNVGFHFILFPRKTNDKISQKIQKPYFGTILAFFAQTWIFCQFLNIPIIYHGAKNQKKLVWHSWGKCWTDGWMDRQMEWWRDNPYFVEPSAGRESNYYCSFKLSWIYTKNTKNQFIPLISL